MFKQKVIILVLAIVWLLSLEMCVGLSQEENLSTQEVSESEESPPQETQETQALKAIEELEKLATEPSITPTQKIEPSPVSVTTPGKISLAIKGMDILDVLKMLAQQTGLNIVVGKNVTGRVTMFLKDVEPWDALEIVLLANNLAYEKKNNLVNVMTDRDYEMLYGEKFQDKKQLLSLRLKFAKAQDVSKALIQIKTNIGKIVVDEGTNTLILMDVPERIKQMQEIVGGMDRQTLSETFALSYAKVEKIQPVLQETITKGVGSIKADTQTNKIIVTDYPEKILEISHIIKAFDEKIPQVLIESKIVEVTLSDEFKMGIDWEYWLKKNVDLKGMFSQSLSTGGRVTVGTMTVVDELGEYRAVVEALRTIGTTNTLSTPRITVVNNQEAKILVGTKQPYVTRTTVTGEGGTVTIAEAITFVDVGIKLYVTPTINKDGFITMKIRPEVSSTGTPHTTAQGEQIPVVSTTEAETTVTVKDGATILIAGLMKDKKEKTVNKIPILGDIPLLGIFFKKTQETITKTELVIFLTPHLFSGETTYPVS